ncbi:acyl-CoA synthetase [Micromonospora sp. WMMA1363]|uniref:acyl-CoA synthetase n=1 Tax=Micromonospora sp. WMMA1363 TaxID=3053985 RepID=UPI00259C94DC|nr:acyl-CoA synthetase [Micromonospora sp. WMMA1363]MDM4719398.1 acyl-CoA synthetase [Micromonospora sp. WMMA1363]
MANPGVWNIAHAAPGSVAVVESDGRQVTYAELAAEADRIGRGLRTAGLATGDSVAVLLPNSAALLAVYFAALQTGLYVVPLNWHLVGAEVAHILTDAAARCFIVHERFAGVAAEAAEAARIAPSGRFAVGSVPGFRPLAELGAGGSGRPTGRTLGAPMVYTSGTSGRPKGVRRPLSGADPDQVPPHAIRFFEVFGLRPFAGHVHLCCSPLYHTAVLSFATIAVQLGHPAVLIDRWDPEQTLRLVERHQVTHSHLVPIQFRRLLALPESVRAAYDLSSMRAVIHSAAPCPPEVKRRMMQWWGPVVVEYYAATEGGGTVIGAEEWLRRPGSVGRPWPGSRVRILDSHGRDLPAGAHGQVYLEMEGSTFEYHGDPEKTRAARVGRLFTVGDIGYLDEAGYLYLCDRRADMIISGGVNIYPAEIESELSVHPKVADVAVFGIPHDEWGEEIKAVVQPAAGIRPGPELTSELMEFLTGRLARFKLPRSVDYTDELPRDPNGKLYKRLLREPYWSGRDRQI